MSKDFIPSFNTSSRVKNVLHRLDTKQYPIVDLLYILTFWRFFTKWEMEALSADADLVDFPEMVPNHQVQRNYCGLLGCHQNSYFSLYQFNYCVTAKPLIT